MHKSAVGVISDTVPGWKKMLRICVLILGLLEQERKMFFIVLSFPWNYSWHSNLIVLTYTGFTLDHFLPDFTVAENNKLILSSWVEIYCLNLTYSLVTNLMSLAPKTANSKNLELLKIPLVLVPLKKAFLLGWYPVHIKNTCYCYSKKIYMFLFATVHINFK